MDRWKEKLCLEHTWYLYLCVFLLLAFISWQQSLIADCAGTDDECGGQPV